MNNTKQIFKKLASPASLFIFPLTFSISIIIGYILTQNSELQISEIKNEWYEQSGDMESDKNFEELKQIKNKLEDIANEIQQTNNRNETYQKKMVDCNNHQNETKIDFDNKWILKKIRNGDSYEKVNYDNICNIGSWNSNKAQDDNSRFAINFAEKIIDGFHGKNATNKLPQKTSVENIEDYSERWMQYFLGAHFKKLSSIKFLWVYIANSNKQMLLYPASEIKVPLQDAVTERPWWKYAQKHENKQLNITPPYIDINDDPTKDNVIRTIVYKFSNNNINYVLGVDLFFDSTQNLNGLDFLKQYIESASIIKNSKFLYFIFIIQTLIIYLLLFWIYELQVKHFLLKNIIPSSSGLGDLKLKLYDIRYAVKNPGNLVITVQGETRETDEIANSREAGWSISFNNINLNQRNSQSNIRQNQSIYTYVSSATYNLDMATEQPSYKCVEIWEAFLEPSSEGSIEKLGFFVATWNTTNSIDIKDELNIKSIIWEKKYAHKLEAVKEQLYNQLSINEEKEFIGILNYSSNKIVNVPQYLGEINFIKKLIDGSLFLNQRKIILPEDEIITEIYKLGTVRAICTLNFLQILKKNNRIEEFFKVTVEERYYVEHEEQDFKKFYESLKDKDKSFFKNTPLFLIMVYQGSNHNIVKPEDDFCIVTIDGKPSLVVYTLTDNRYPNAGAWISWRNIDVEYYTKLYQYQKDKVGRIEAINTYLSNFSL